MQGSADSRSAEWSHAGWSSAGSCGVEMVVRMRASAGGDDSAGAGECGCVWVCVGGDDSAGAGECGCGHGVELGVNGAE